MTAGLRYNLTQLNRIGGALHQMARRGGNPRPMMEEIGAELEFRTVRRFDDTKTAPDGTAWKSTRRGGSILKMSGRLARITHQLVSSTAVAIGSNLIYAGVHQWGATIVAKVADFLRFKIGERWIAARSVTIPARPYLGIAADDERAVLRIVENYMTRPLR